MILAACVVALTAAVLWLARSHERLGRDFDAHRRATLGRFAEMSQPCAKAARRQPNVLDSGVILPQTRDANL